jgi:glycosyltransferase involved in cell wall biosynthesis
MRGFKINIFFGFKDCAWGGANQFLKSLKNTFVNEGLYSDDVERADIILFNSHQHADDIMALKKRFPSKLFVHRVDGPTRLYNNMADGRDAIVYDLNRQIADATVFQSEWSKNQNFNMGLNDDKPNTVILNAADPLIFHQKGEPIDDNLVRIISTSFSSNINKGFLLYKRLDNILDYGKYKYTFVGNSPIDFRNIKSVGPKNPTEISSFLNKSDIYITASKNDPCSNSLIEALSCGLCCFALKSGGHPEILQHDDAFLYDNAEDLVEKMRHRSLKTKNMPPPSIKDTVVQYLNFFQTVVNA